MGRISVAVSVALVLALCAGAFGQEPDRVLGTDATGRYLLYTPGDMVQAGASEAASTYRFFHHADIAPQTVSSGNLPVTLTLLASTLFSDGLQFGPFHTQYEGSIEFNFTTGAGALTLTVSTEHIFQNGKSLTTRRVDTERVSSTGGVFAISQFSSVTNLQPGTVTFDDGSTGTIDAALLAAPVTIEIKLRVTADRSETIRKVAFSSNAGLTMYQLRDPILNAGSGGGGGSTTPLSNTVPLADSGSGRAGTAGAASRGDHVHPATGGSATPLSDTTPKDLGTAAAGSATAASRGDHVHKRPTEIADNTAAIATQAAADVRLTAAITSLENDLYRPSGAISDGDVLTAVDCKGSPVATCMSEWKAQTGGGGGGDTGLPPFAGAGKHLATNADDDAAVWVTPPPDLTDDVAANDNDIEALDFLTQDLIGGTPSTGWATVTDTTNAGIALFNGEPSCNAARGATYQTAITSGVGGKYSAVRIKAGFALANVRVEVKGQGETYEDLISGWSLLCTSGDGNFAYYHELYGDAVLAWGTGVASVAMQTTGGAHIGTSKYVGDPTKVERWGIVGNATHIPISKTLPAITGHGGNVLTVNSGATGVEWRDAGGGGGEAGGCTRTEILPATPLKFSSIRYGAEVSGATAAKLFKIVRDAEYDFLVLTYMQIASLQSDTQRFQYQTLIPLTAVKSTTTTVSLSFTGRPPRDGTGFRGTIGGDTEDMGVSIFLSGISDSRNWNLFLDGLTCGGSGGGDSGPSLPSPTPGGALDVLRVNAAGGAYELATPYSTAAPKPPGTAAVGTALTLARSDHVHALPAIPQGSTDTPEADSANGAAGSSNKWSPSDHSHPITDHDTVTWSNAQVSTLTGGGASGGVTCDGSAASPTTAACKGLVDAFRRGDYNFFLLRVARYDDNDNNEPLHMSGCPLYPGIPSAIFTEDVVADTACTANSGKNSANTFNQYDVFVKFGNTGNYIQVRLPNYNSYGVDNVTVTLTGVR
ncbi:MAG: hypothetical protein F4169_20525 [Gammaproteobacteria bacterium]|nr:hypothetical protein [Gammaproteobacteria bacterium]